MKKALRLIVLSAMLLAIGSPLLAQPPKRVSPHDVIGGMVDGGRIMIVYGRPYSKHPKSGEVRKIWGGLVPFGKVWRTGANEATLLITPQPIMIGEAAVPAGTYSLFTLPAEDGTAKLIINKQFGQWGTQYDEKQDLARVDMKKDALETAVDQFTMVVEKNAAGGAWLKLMWENIQYSIAVTAKK